MENTEQSLSKFNIFLFILLIVLVGVLAILNVSNRGNDLSVSDALVPCTTDAQCATGQKCVDANVNTNGNKVCSDVGIYNRCDKVAKECDAGLTCVQGSSDFFTCSDLKINNSCDKTSKTCADGLSCLDMHAGSYELFKCGDGSNYSVCDKNSSTAACDTGLSCVSYYEGSPDLYRCSNGDQDSYCGVDADCDEGLSCVNAGNNLKRCTENKVNQYCEKGSTTCSDGTQCIDMDTSTNEIYRCTDTKLGNPCNNEVQCSDASKCITYNVGNSWMRCSDGSSGRLCNTTSDCQEGNTCVNRGDGNKFCTDGNPGSFCSTNTDCNSGGQCVAGANNVKTCIAAGNNPTCGPNSFGSCEDGKSCVKFSSNGYACSTLNSSDYCDMDSKTCNSGNCIDYTSTADNGSTYTTYTCQSGLAGSLCMEDADCDSAYSCESLTGQTVNRCLLKDQESRKEGSFCDESNACASGYSCVSSSQTDESMTCSKTIEGQTCDKEDKTCSDGSTCIVKISGTYMCTTDVEGGLCSEDSDCGSDDFTCKKLGDDTAKRCIAKDNETRTEGDFCDETSACASGLQCVSLGGVMSDLSVCSALNEGSICEEEGSECSDDSICTGIRQPDGNTALECVSQEVIDGPCGPTTFGTCENETHECIEYEPDKFTCTTVVDNEPDVVSCQKLDSNNSGKVDLSDFDYIVRNWNQLCGGI